MRVLVVCMIIALPFLQGDEGRVDELDRIIENLVLEKIGANLTKSVSPWHKVARLKWNNLLKLQLNKLSKAKSSCTKLWEKIAMRHLSASSRTSNQIMGDQNKTDSIANVLKEGNRSGAQVKTNAVLMTPRAVISLLNNVPPPRIISQLVKVTTESGLRYPNNMNGPSAVNNIGMSVPEKLNLIKNFDSMRISVYPSNMSFPIIMYCPIISSSRKNPTPLEDHNTLNLFLPSFLLQTPSESPGSLKPASDPKFQIGLNYAIHGTTSSNIDTLARWNYAIEGTTSRNIDTHARWNYAMPRSTSSNIDPLARWNYAMQRSTSSNIDPLARWNYAMSRSTSSNTATLAGWNYEMPRTTSNDIAGSNFEIPGITSSDIATNAGSDYAILGTTSNIFAGSNFEYPGVTSSDTATIAGLNFEIPGITSSDIATIAGSNHDMLGTTSSNFAGSNFEYPGVSSSDTATITRSNYAIPEITSNYFATLGGLNYALPEATSSSIVTLAASPTDSGLQVNSTGASQPLLGMVNNDHRTGGFIVKEAFQLNPPESNTTYPPLSPHPLFTIHPATDTADLGFHFNSSIAGDMANRFEKLIQGLGVEMRRDPEPTNRPSSSTFPPTDRTAQPYMPVGVVRSGTVERV